ncbi:MAG: hypothetical protein AAFO73_01010, partial [Pseudomonadota bacterium]
MRHAKKPAHREDISHYVPAAHDVWGEALTNAGPVGTSLRLRQKKTAAGRKEALMNFHLITQNRLTPTPRAISVYRRLR